jgi:hypothetical protein
MALNTSVLRIVGTMLMMAVERERMTKKGFFVCGVYLDHEMARLLVGGLPDKNDWRQRNQKFRGIYASH